MYMHLILKCQIETSTLLDDMGGHTLVLGIEPSSMILGKTKFCKIKLNFFSKVL